MGVEGNAGGGGVARERCSSLYFEPSFAVPCCSFQDPFLLMFVEILVCFFEVFIVVVCSSHYCTSVIFQPICWNWALLIWHEKRFALGAAHSY